MGENIVSAKQLDYHQDLYSHPEYQFEPQLPNTYGATISLGSSLTPVILNIQAVVHNYPESILSYTVNLPEPATNARFIWTAKQAYAEIAHIQLYGGSGQFIADLDNVQNYVDIVAKKELSFDEFKALDGTINRLGLSDAVKANMAASRNSNMTAANANNGVAYDASLNYLEPAYFTAGGVSNGAGGGNVTYNVQLKLGLLKNTIFSVDKSFYFGQTIYLKIFFGPLSKVAYQSDTGASINGGIKADYTGAATITNLQLMLAVEHNENIKADIMNKVNSSGQTYLIPYVQAFKNSNQGISQNINLTLDAGFGKTLMKVYHAPYNSMERLNTMYDHCNTSNVPGGDATANAPQKTQVYYTQLNGQRIQNININCSPTASSFT